MKKRIIVAGILLSVLYSCSSSKYESDKKIYMSQNTDISISNTNTTISTENEKDDTSGIYLSSVGTISAEALYNTNVVIMPESINKHNYTLCGIKGEKIVVETQSDNLQDSNKELGLFDTKDSSYENIVSCPKSFYFLCANNNYYVFKNISDDKLSLELYNSDTSEFKTIFEFVDDLHFDDKSATFFNDKFLFGISEKDDISIYEYDINTGENNKFMDHAMRPFVTNNELKYINIDPNTKKYDKVINHSDKSEFFIYNKKLVDLVWSGNSIFGLITVYGQNAYNDPLDYSMQVIELSQNGNDSEIVSTQFGNGKLLENLKTNSFCIAWNDWTGSKSTPCVYDVKQNKIVLFDNYEESYYSSFLSDKIGLIYDPLKFKNDHRICIFSPKESL